MMLKGLAGILVLVATPVGVDFAARYKPVLDYEESAGGRDWTATKDDVWKLKSFKYGAAGKIEIECGPSVAVLGRCGTSVVWATVVPLKPGKIVDAPQGKNEAITSIFLRFHPSLVRDVFPAATLDGQGPPAGLLEARWIYANKINAAWQWDNLPVVPMKESIVIDVETSAMKRRMYMIDLKKNSVRHEDAFVERPVKPLQGASISKDDSLKAFDAAFEAFEREYAMFMIKPFVNWEEMRTAFRPLAANATNSGETALAIDALTAQLQDLHVHVNLGDAFLPGFNRFRPMNGTWSAVPKIVGPVADAGNDVHYARSSDGIGYIAVNALEKEGTTASFDAALEKCKDTKALIVDLRFNGGGDETLGVAMAGRFTDADRVYAKNRYRSGPAHKDLGPALDRKFSPRGPWRYTNPVVALQGRKTMSSAESFAMMLAQCPNVVTMGDNTAGSSANPKRVDVGANISVNVPRWIDLDVDSKPIDVVGVAPKVPVQAAPREFRGDQDPVLTAALQRLRKK